MLDLHRRLVHSAGADRIGDVGLLFAGLEVRHTWEFSRRLRRVDEVARLFSQNEFYRVQPRPEGPREREFVEAFLMALSDAPQRAESVAAATRRSVPAVRAKAQHLLRAGAIVRVAPGVFGLPRSEDAGGGYEPARLAILRALGGASAMTTRQLLAVTGKTRSAVDAELFRLVASGEVVRVYRGVFALARARAAQ